MLMAHTFTIYSLFFLVTSLVSFFGGFLAWQRRGVRGAYILTILMIASGIGALPIIFETASLTVTEKIFWSKLEFLGGTLTPVLYFLFVLRFTGNDRFLTKKKIAYLFIMPVITLLLIFTNEKHNLIWSGYSPISPATHLMEYHHGIGFWICYILYNYILLFIATIKLFIFILRNRKSFQHQGIIVLLGGLLPWSASFLYLTGINITPGLDLTPASITISGILSIYAILYTRFLNLVPIARATLVETLPDGILAIDEFDRIQDYNEAAISYLGISPEKKIHGLSLHISGASASALLNAVMSKESVDQIEINTEKGMTTFRVIIQPVKNQPKSRLVIIRDISDHISQQKEILAAEERYRKLSTLFRLMADNMPDMLWAKDLDKNFIFTNRAICENLLFTKDTDEPIGKSDSLFLNREREKHPELPEWHSLGNMHPDSDDEVIKSGKVARFDEYGNIRGEFMYLDIRKAPIIDDQGVMIGVVGSGRDITVEKKAEAEIQKRDTLLEAIAKATALLVRSDDIEDNIIKVLEILGTATKTNRAYIFRNQSDPNSKYPLTSQIYEWTDGAAEPQIDNQKMQNVPYDSVSTHWFEHLSAGGVISGKMKDFSDSEIELLKPQNIKSLLIAPIFVDNNFWGFMGFDDCLNEKEWLPTEEQILAATAKTIGGAYLQKYNRDELIRAKEKVEESDRLKSAFLANMSHEIRTPMNGILGFTELLKEPKLTGEEQQEYIRIIEKSGNRMLNIINDIISTSTLESGLVKAHLSEVDVNELLNFIYEFFKPQAEEKGLKLILGKALSENDAKAYTDKEKLYAILTNLTKNAIKFTSLGFIEIGCHKESAGLEFFVKDTGIGIIPEHKDMIFERFRQGSESITRNYEGAGLGLSISKAYVELLDGRMWVESEPGKGSEFHFTIPVNINTREASSSC